MWLDLFKIFVHLWRFVLKFDPLSFLLGGFESELRWLLKEKWPCKHSAIHLCELFLIVMVLESVSRYFVNRSGRLSLPFKLLPQQFCEHLFTLLSSALLLLDFLLLQVLKYFLLMIESDHRFIFECRSYIISSVFNSALSVLTHCFLKTRSTLFYLFFFDFRWAQIELHDLSWFYFSFFLIQLLLKLFM